MITYIGKPGSSMIPYYLSKSEGYNMIRFWGNIRIMPIEIQGIEENRIKNDIKHFEVPALLSCERGNTE